MAEICRFYGVVIAMFARDHNPPHIHLRYGDYQMTMPIDCGIVRGDIPNSLQKKVAEWIKLHREELLENWERLQRGEEINRIEALK